MENIAEERHLICPNCSDKRRLVEDETDETEMECLFCNYRCQNYLKYPLAQVVKRGTCEIVFQNVFTGEYFTET